MSLNKYEKHCDVFLVDECTKEKWPMISTLLKCKSNYFDALLDTKWNPSKKNEFSISTNESWPKIRTWIFTGKLSLTPFECCSALKFADKYDFEELIEEITQKLTTQVEFKHIKKHLDFLMCERFAEVLICFRKAIIQNYFEPSPMFAFLAAVVSRELMKSSTRVWRESNWITASATFHKYNGKETRKDLPHAVVMNLIGGLSLVAKEIKIAVDCMTFNDEFTFNVFGVTDKQELSEVRSIHKMINNKKSFNSFVIFSSFAIDQNKLISFIFQGDYSINLGNKVYE